MTEDVENFLVQQTLEQSWMAVKQLELFQSHYTLGTLEQSQTVQSTEIAFLPPNCIPTFC